MATRKRDGEQLKPPSVKLPRFTVPDGFAQARPAAKIAAPKFVSGFGDAGSHSSRQREKQPLHRPLKPPAFPEPDSKGKNVAGPILAAVTSDKPRSGKLMGLSAFHLHEVDLSPMKTGARREKPPSAFRSHIVDKAGPSTKPLLPPALPAAPIASASRKPNSVRSIATPLQIAPTTPNKLGEREMKTISTTAVALATDVHSDSGGAELLSIFVQQHGHEFLNSSERELSRGLVQSPEKRSKTKEPKYIKGGLADRARSTFRQNDTQLRLWNEDLQRDIRAFKRITPDIHLRVISLLHISPASPRPPHPPVIAFLRCTDVTSSKEVAILLNFGVPSPAPRMNRVEDLKAGGDVYVWQPWQTMDLTEAGILALVRVLNDVHNAAANSSAFPSRNVLMCSRFWIVPAKL